MSTYLVETVLQLLGAGLLDLVAALVLGHLLEVVDLVLQLVLLGCAAPTAVSENA